jgi:hypothetical protein
MHHTSCIMHPLRLYQTHTYTHAHTLTHSHSHTHTFIHSIISLWRKDTNFRSPKHTRARIDDAYTTYTTYTRPQDRTADRLTDRLTG